MTMRNRKAIIVSFVLVACLLIGVGYASITGSLDITGNTFFYSASETGAQVHQAVKFKSAATQAISDPDSVSCNTSLTGDDTADLSIVFTDTDIANTSTTYYAIVKYEVIYETADQALPDADFSQPILTAGGSNATYTYYQNEACTDEWTDAEIITLSPNATYETFEFYVKVVYTENGTETGILKGFPKITLNYSAD